MTANRKVTGTAVSMPKGLMIGNTISIVLTVLMAGILAKLVSAERLEWDQIGYGIMILLFVSSATGTTAAVKAIKPQRLAVCLLAGGIYWLTLLAITALFFGGQYHGIAATGATILAGCGTICLLGIRSKKGSGRRQSRRRRQ